MTDKEAELLRAVESAAREILAPHNLGRIIHGWHPLFEAIQAISAYRAQPQEAMGETVEVRAYIRLAANGSAYIVSGMGSLDGKWHDTAHVAAIAAITARVPIPAIPTIPAKVVA